MVFMGMVAGLAESVGWLVLPPQGGYDKRRFPPGMSFLPLPS
jgi:hypothetical protein